MGITLSTQPFQIPYCPDALPVTTGLDQPGNLCYKTHQELEPLL